MASTANAPRKAGSESAVPVPFSYAQAAKGLSSSATSAPQSSKSVSGAATPSKDSNSSQLPISTVPSGMIWADDDDTIVAAGEKELDKDYRSNQSQPNGSSALSQSGTSQRRSSVSVMSSPELGTSSASTIAKEDDLSSIPNASSESTWDNKSQVSNAVEKSSDQVDAASEKSKGKEGKKEKRPQKSLKEAPIPSVNPWKVRAEAQAKAAPTNIPASTATASSSGGVSRPQSEKSIEPAKTDLKKNGKTGLGGAGEPEGPTPAVKDKKPSSEITRKGGNNESAASGRRDPQDADVATSKQRPTSIRPYEKKDVNGAEAPLPLVHDEESWPTPMNAREEEKKKVHEKGDKGEKEWVLGSGPKAGGKKEYTPLPYTPSVVFSTPIPNTNPRRGGRGGGRGGRDSGHRGGSYATNGIPSGDKDASQQTSLPNGDSRRGREASPGKGRRATSAGSTSRRDGRLIGSSAEPSSKVTSLGDVLTEVDGASNENALAGNYSAASNTFPRQQSSRQKQSRRYDSSTNEKRREGDPMSPSRDEAYAHHYRRSSTATQTDENGEKKYSAASENGTPHSKHGGSERRNGAFGSFSGRERGEGRGRGGMRGGRNYQNTHGSFPNGHQPLQTSSTFPLPRSPTTFHDPNNAFFQPPPQSSRNFRGAGPRSQSIPNEPVYGRFPPGYPNMHPGMAPLQTFMPGMYEYSMMHPMSAMPYTPVLDPLTSLSGVAMQLEYYFSIDNLCKDMFLRKRMDSKGFVLMGVIADFRRIKALTSDMDMIRLACFQSPTIEYKIGSDGKDCIRLREGWEKWVLERAARDPSAQNDGPEVLHHPPRPVPRTFEVPYPGSYPPSATRSPSSPSPLPGEAVFQSLNGLNSTTSPTTIDTGAPDMMNGGMSDHSNNSPTRPQVATGPPSFPIGGPSGSNPEDQDSFSDDQKDSLTVIVRQPELSQPQTPFHSAESRTFSNGSIDIRSVADEIQRADVKRPEPQINGTGPTPAEDGQRVQHLRSTMSPPPTGRDSPAQHLGLFWVKDRESPVDKLPQHTTCELYTVLRSKALEQRNSAPLENCPHDMDVLYQFWSHFLIRNFNSGMYEEFWTLAHQDASENQSDTGLKCLVKYYGEALNSHHLIREAVAHHYVELVKSEDPQGARPAFKQLRSAWRNGALNLKNRKRIRSFIDDDLSASLEQ